MDVVLTGHEVRVCEDGSKLVHLPFDGEAIGDLFKGTTLPGAADDQIHRNGQMETATADYVIEGTDFTGERCSVHVVNRFVKGSWKPTVTTDSKALDFLNSADCVAFLEIRFKGPIVHIFAKR